MREIDVHEMRQVFGAGGPAHIGGAFSGALFKSEAISTTVNGVDVTITPDSVTVSQGSSIVNLALTGVAGSVAAAVMSSNESTSMCGVVIGNDSISISCNDGSAVSCDASGESCSVGSNGGDW